MLYDLASDCFSNFSSLFPSFIMARPQHLFTVKHSKLTLSLCPCNNSSLSLHYPSHHPQIITWLVPTYSNLNSNVIFLSKVFLCAIQVHTPIITLCYTTLFYFLHSIYQSLKNLAILFTF